MNKNGLIINGLIGLGVLGFVSFLYLMFFCEIRNDTFFGLLMACIISLLYPFGILYKEEILTTEILPTTIIASAALFLNILIVLLTKQEGYDFINYFLIVITSKLYLWLLLALFIIAGVCTTLKKPIGIWPSAILLGILLPVILAAVVYLILCVIAIIIVYIFNKNSSGTSANNSFQSLSNNKKTTPSSRNMRDKSLSYTFFIVWSDGVHAPHSYTQNYPRNVSIEKVKKDLKKKCGSTAQLIDFHIYDSAHDSTLNYV